MLADILRRSLFDSEQIPNTSGHLNDPLSSFPPSVPLGKIP